MKIDRCICFNKTFAELKHIADEVQVHQLVILQKHIQFGEKCKLCHPYIKTMLQSGETEFYHLLGSDL